MIKRYGLGWLDLEITLAADLTFSAFKMLRRENEEKNDMFMFQTYLTLQQTYAIKTVMASDYKPFPTFEEFKAPKQDKKPIDDIDKDKLKADAERIKKKFRGD